MSCDVLKCDIYDGINQFKSRYDSVIVIFLSNNKSSFTEIKGNFNYLTSTQLLRSINKLMDNGIISKKDNNYYLTDKGNELIFILEEINTWKIKNQ